MTFFQELYLGPRNSATWAGEHWTASPVRAPQDLLRKCPKTTIIIAEQDLLYAESVQFAKTLQEEGVDVDVKIYKKAPHVFMAMGKCLVSGRQATRYVVERVKEILVAYVEHSLDIKPSDFRNERDRQILSGQAEHHRNIG
jgi:acetyl esterase/lipase